MRNLRIAFCVLSVVACNAFLPSKSYAVTVLPGLIGGDLTDPENDGNDATPAGSNFNATFNASTEASFDGGSEAAFNVFDNKVSASGGETKYCCGTDFSNTPFTVDATLSSAYVLTKFTLTSSNDSPERDPRVFKIQGANSPTGPFTDIYSRTDATTDPFSAFNQTLEFDAGTDFATPAAFSTFRLLVTGSNATSGNSLALSEIEYFGTAVPEPTSLALFGLASAGILARRRRML